MKDTDAIRALAALANPHRLALFRALVRAGGKGMSAGELALAAGIRASTLTFHTKELERAGLTVTRREGRFIRSALDEAAMRELISFLTQDCCAGRPDLCGMASLSAPSTVQAEACSPSSPKPKKVST
jgi:ArsR family transcriptional regulator